MADVLIVDDDTDIAELLTMVLEEEGHDVRVAYDGTTGLQLARAHLPNLVLLDVEMPIMNGPDMAMRMLVEDCGLESVPIILSSAVPYLERIAAGVGTPYYLKKPYDDGALSNLVTRALTEKTPPTPQREK
jgi:DNA-binding response OmpR family regulator